MIEPKHKTIKVRYSTYHELKKLAAEKPESLAALIDRLTRAERERRSNLKPDEGAGGDEYDPFLDASDRDYFPGDRDAGEVWT
jgi:hypothetical protein